MKLAIVVLGSLVTVCLFLLGAVYAVTQDPAADGLVLWSAVVAVLTVAGGHLL